MHFAHVIPSRKLRVWVVLIALAILLILIATFFLQSRRSPKPFEMTEHERPEVPVEWLKSEWRKRGLLKRVQLTISGCVGPCDVPNVVVIASSSGTEWLGNIVKFDQYRSLLEWAVRCRDAGEMLTLPHEFHVFRINPFCSS
jgi:hypothetical protein